MKVRKLCHITHNQEASEIKRRDECIFKVKSKYGKSGYGKYNGTPVGNSYEMYEPTKDLPTISTEYKHVDSTRKLLPGFYSWWSIDGTNNYKKEYSFTPSDVFIDPPQSRYGNRKFSFDILPLLKAYQNSYPRKAQDMILPKIVFRCGGTLRYRHEICYVVIICTEWSTKLNDEKYPKMWNNIERAYHSYSNGEIYHINPIKVAIKNGIRRTSRLPKSNSHKTKFDYYSWDTFAFAFYFPHKDCELKCPNRDIDNIHTVCHHLCNKSQPINGDSSYIYVCPNKLPPVVRRESIESEEEDNEDGETIDTKHYHKKRKISTE